MKKIFLCLGLAGALFAADEGVKFELTPTFNYNVFEGNLDLDNHLAPGVRLGYHFDDFWLDQLELGLEYYSGVHYSNDKSTNVMRTFLSAIKGVDVGEKFYFYGLAGGGYEGFSHGDLGNKSGGFGHYGAGVKYKFSDSLALRLETRDQINSNNAHHNWITTFGISFGLGGAKGAKIDDSVKKEHAILQLRILGNQINSEHQETNPVRVARPLFPDLNTADETNRTCLPSYLRLPTFISTYPNLTHISEPSTSSNLMWLLEKLSNNCYFYPSLIS